MWHWEKEEDKEDPHPGPLPQAGEGGREEVGRMPALLAEKTEDWKPSAPEDEEGRKEGRKGGREDRV